MFSLDAYFELARVDVNKAKEYCLKYEDDIFAKCELVILDIGYFNQRNLEENSSLLKEYYTKLKKSNYKDRIGYIIASSCFDLFDYNEVVKYGKNIVNKINNEYLSAIYNLSLVYLRKENDEIIDNLTSILYSSGNNFSSVLIHALIYAIGNYYFLKGNNKKADEVFSKCYLILENKEVIARASLRLRVYHDGNEDRLREDFNTWRNFSTKEFHYLFFSDLVQLYDFAQVAPELTKDIHEELISNGLVDDKDNEYMNSATIEYCLSNYKEAYEIFKKINNEKLHAKKDILFNFADTIYNTRDRRLYGEAIEIIKGLVSSNELNESMNRYMLHVLRSIYYEQHEFAKLEQLMDEHKQIFSNELKGLCLASRGEYDLAFNYIKKDYNETKKPSAYYNFFKVKDDAVSDKIFNDFNSGKTGEDYRNLALMYFHGFGIAKSIDTNKALEYAIKGRNMEPNRNCHCSVLGAIYLALNEYDKAFNLFKEGYKSYINHKENCACSLGFYCYCLIFGYGCKKDEDKAFKILDEFNYKDASDVIVYDYAYLCLKRNVNLKRAYDLLLEHNEWRYDLGKYFLLIKVAKKLGLEYKGFEKKFKENIKHVPIREREYYKSNPEVFYLTNI